MKCKDCTIWACIRRRDGEQQCYYEEKKTAYEDVFWYRFRAEAAKDILCAMINRESSFTRNGNPVTKHDDFIEMAIIDVDVLISKLKEKEEG